MTAPLPRIAFALALSTFLATAGHAEDPSGSAPQASPAAPAPTPAPPSTSAPTAAPGPASAATPASAPASAPAAASAPTAATRAPAPATAPAPRDAASGQATGRRSVPLDGPGGPARPRVFRKVGTGEVVTPEPGMAQKKWKDCTYDGKGRVTNAPCTGTQKDDKGVTWWPA